MITIENEPVDMCTYRCISLGINTPAVYSHAWEARIGISFYCEECRTEKMDTALVGPDFFTSI